MGSRGPASKKKDRQGDTVERTIVPLKDVAIAIPGAPEDVSLTVAAAWDEYSVSDVARVLDMVDLPLLTRWAYAYDEWLTTMKTVKNEGPYVEGSKGQPVLSPVVKYLNELEARLAKYEAQLGMTPLARARLGLTIAEGALTAAHLNEMATASGDEETDGDDLAEVIDLDGWEVTG